MAVNQRCCVSPVLSLGISSMTCCQVRLAASGSPAFQYTRARCRLKAGASSVSFFASQLLRVFVFVSGGDEADRFFLVAGLEGGLLFGDEVFAIVGAPATAEHPVTVFHVLIHVVSMNHPTRPALGCVAGAL